MKRVTGIGGIFFKCEDPEMTKKWYHEHLGIQSDQYGTSFEWRKSDTPEEKGYTAWSPMPKTTQYFNPSESQFMVNYRVENLEELIKTLKDEGVEVVGEVESFEYGKFAHILDPDGIKIELWEPKGIEYDKILKVRMK
jgi:predicted enzyme related to lactoylglutathione lyase